VIESRSESGQRIVASGQVIGAPLLFSKMSQMRRPDVGQDAFAAAQYNRKSQKNNGLFVTW
jgi:hypothetical protein